MVAPEDPITTEGAPPFAANARDLQAELDWLAAVLDCRLAQQAGAPPSSVYALPPPPLDHGASMYANFVGHYALDVQERLAVLLALTPHVRPQLLDGLFVRNPATGRGHTEVGGLEGQAHGGFLPTGETLLWLLAEEDLGHRFACGRLFDRDHVFARHNLLRLEPPPPGEPVLSGRLVLADEIIDFLTSGRLRKPDFSRDFPARLLQTEMTWGELVLAPQTRDQLRELLAWAEHEQALMDGWRLGRRLRPGYTCLFYGPPGTGKTLAATLLGQRIGRDVYRVDLSTVVSKYIGETEKNLERVFERAANMSCVLFFDEADALFGKRTDVSDAHDRYANQEVSYLLQRIEDFPGLVILASNFKSNLDDAFLRRFAAVVPFPMPSPAERVRLWRESIPPQAPLADDVDLEEIARRYEMAGGSILNVVRYVCLMALSRGGTPLRHVDLVAGIRRELQKEGKTL